RRTRSCCFLPAGGLHRTCVLPTWQGAGGVVMRTGRVLALSMILAAVGAAPAAAQATDPAFVAEQNAFWAQQQAAQQQSLELERQAFAAEQRAQTSQTLSDLSAARRGQP